MQLSSETKGNRGEIESCHQRNKPETNTTTRARSNSHARALMLFIWGSETQYGGQ